MKPIKSLLCCLLAVLSLAAAHFIPSVSAHAEMAVYARADSRYVYFCERKDTNYALFAIPYTYCVEVLATEGDWYYVKYAEDLYPYKARRGYCLRENLTIVSEPPENIYLNMSVTVTFRPDSPAGSLPVLSDMNVTAAFYGTFYADTEYSYVLYNDQFGYIYGANDDYPLNEIPVEVPSTPSGEKSKNGKLIIILSISGIAIATVLVLYFTGRKRYFKP